MDPRTFDGLTRRLVSALDRRRMVAVSAAAAVAALVGQQAEPALGKKQKKRQICHCPTNDPSTCVTIKAKKRAAKQHLKHHCDYAGPCQPGKVGECVAPSECTKDSQCSGSQVCRDGNCVAGCKNDGDCNDGFQCKNGGCVCEANKVLCQGQCVDLKSDTDNCGACGRACSGNEVCSNGFTCQAAACLPVTEIENDVRLADNGGLELVAAGGVYGAFNFGVPNNTAFSQVSSVISEYEFLSGTCGAGTPRVCFRFSTRTDCVCGIFPPTSGCNTAGADGSTGNLIGNNTPFDWEALCGSGAQVRTYDQALAEFGDDIINEIFLVADSSNGTQDVIVRPCILTA